MRWQSLMPVNPPNYRQVLWPNAWGKPLTQAVFKRYPQAFCVEEHLGYQLAGHGEHLYLQIYKINQNTFWVAQQLAKYYAVATMDVSYAGLKDRYAAISQWFSIYLPKSNSLALPETILGVKILQATRHTHKLRRGQFAYNRFAITLDLWDCDPEAFAHRVQQIATFGVPNYFGPQRFGHGGNNVPLFLQYKAQWRRCPRHQRGLYLSAARAFLFNALLAARVHHKNWDQPLLGESLIHSKSKKCLQQVFPLAQLQQWVATQIWHPSGPLWGRSRLPLMSLAQARLETQIGGYYTELFEALRQFEVKLERRALRMVPWAFNTMWLGGQAIRLYFTLPPGGFATSVLKELVTLKREDNAYFSE